MPPSTRSRSATAGDVLGPILRHRVAVFRTREAQLRLDEPDAAQRFQVSARRLGSLLTAFGMLLDPTTGTALEAELNATSRTVGGARDAQVQRRCLESLLGEEPDPRAVGQVQKRLTDLLDSSYRDSWQQAITYFDSPGYDSFTRTLDGFADLPPWTPAAGTAAADVFVPVLREEWTRLLSRGRDVQELEPGPDRDRRLQAVHRTATLVRDLGEAPEVVSGRRVRRLRKVAGALGRTLGEYHDVVMTGELLGTVSSYVEGADTGVQQLHRRQAAAAATSYDTYVERFREVDRTSLRSWMS